MLTIRHQNFKLNGEVITSIGLKFVKSMYRNKSYVSKHMKINAHIDSSIIIPKLEFFAGKPITTTHIIQLIIFFQKTLLAMPLNKYM